MLTTQQRTTKRLSSVMAQGLASVARGKGTLGTVGRWLVAWVAAFGLTMGLVAVTLHPPAQHLYDLAKYLFAGGALSLLAAIGLRAATLTGRFSGARARFAMPVVLTAVVISVNVMIVARLMFLAAPDSVLVLAILVFGVVLAVSVSTSLAEATASALQRVEASARTMAAGEYGVRVPEDDLGGGAEVARLGRWFNQMAASVEGAFDRQRRAERERRQIVAALSHDLRTPLASIRVMIEAITDGVVTQPETVERYHRTIRGEVRHLTALIDDLFELARLEALPAGTMTLRREVVALEDIVSDTLEAMRGQATAHGVCLSGRIEGELPPVAVDARQIHRVLTNLLQNALRHTRAGGHVVIHASAVRDPISAAACQIVVRVADDGDGIADADLPHVFEPTFRGERSRRRDGAKGQDAIALADGTATGAGLGLTIARGLVEAHAGTITAESPLSPASASLLRDEGADGVAPPIVFLGPGTCLTVTLPL